MKKLKLFFGSLSAFLYFILVMWWIILLLAFLPIMLLDDIRIIMESGFSTVNSGMIFIGIFGLFIGLSLLIPSIRKMYYSLPWLFPYVRILYIDVVILGIATTILNYGYELQNTTRHAIFFILTIVQIVLCRIAMCIYLCRNPVKQIGGENE